ncbi:MAG: hypothetical protein ACI84K_000181 [Pseudohongiellaceae bacterium]|jgi:hypothetical protein
MSCSEGIGNRLKKLSFICSLVVTTVAQAEMKPISDEDLSQYSGQAAVAFDINQIDDVSYTRVTLGMEADLQVNIDTLEAGRIARAGETLEADISISQLGFGSISTNDTQVQLDGQTYALNDIVPFELNDPFFEIAQDASDEVTGFRLGFGEARGQLSGDFNSISGNVGVDITDYFGDTYRSSMLDSNGNADSVRSSNFGVSRAMTGGATNCDSGFYCYDLADYKTLDVGQRNESTGAVDYADDFFISFQKAPTTWSTSGGNVNAQMGAFINIPTSLHIDMNTGANASGTDRVRTEYIDRSNNLF